ncbi:MAG: hypothetical protein OXB89_11270 [Anaerolineaceae bacterium]|nr:hypothetical protein [Anaerolineaceae bacterium]
MKLPNAEHAVIEEAKITRYLLNLDSRDGHGKAKFFLAHGFSLARWYELEETLLWHAVAHNVVDVASGVDGTLYVIEGVANTPDGRSPYIRSIWFIESGQEIPRLTSAYPRSRRRSQ